MIAGNYYVGADLTITLETGVDLSTKTDLKINVKFPDGTTLEAYTATVVDFSRARATIPLADNDQPGELILQVQATTPEFGVELSSTENIYVLQSYAPPTP